jgi:hypothetical protein
MQFLFKGGKIYWVAVHSNQANLNVGGLRHRRRRPPPADTPSALIQGGDLGYEVELLTTMQASVLPAPGLEILSLGVIGSATVRHALPSLSLIQQLLIIMITIMQRLLCSWSCFKPSKDRIGPVPRQQRYVLVPPQVVEQTVCNEAVSHVPRTV